MKNIALIREPEGVDFVIQSKVLTAKEEKELSEFIAKRKLEIRAQAGKRELRARKRKSLTCSMNIIVDYQHSHAELVQ